jgi:hypothetical protein
MKPIRQYLVMLLLLAYAGQALVATGAPCFMMASSSTVMSTDMPGMDHGGHMMPGPDQADTETGCCDGAGLCSISECQSLAAVPISLVDAAAVLSTVRLPASPIPRFSLDTSPLYRPPIFA